MLRYQRHITKGKTKHFLTKYYGHFFREAKKHNHNTKKSSQLLCSYYCLSCDLPPFLCSQNEWQDKAPFATYAFKLLLHVAVFIQPCEERKSKLSPKRLTITNAQNKVFSNEFHKWENIPQFNSCHNHDTVVLWKMRGNVFEVFLLYFTVALFLRCALHKFV